MEEHSFGDSFAHSTGMAFESLCPIRGRRLFTFWLWYSWFLVEGGFYGLHPERLSFRDDAYQITSANGHPRWRAADRG
jgi:hypothetical protein